MSFVQPAPIAASSTTRALRTDEAEGNCHLARVTDCVVYGVILLLAVLQWTMALRPGDFIGDDAAHYEIARSLLDNHFYGFNSTRETNFPPAFQLFLALLIKIPGSTHSTFIRFMPAFTALAFLACYELLRRLSNRTVAAIACLLPASNVVTFRAATHWVATDLPYFCFSMLALLIAVMLDRSPRKQPWRLSGLLTITVLTALMTRTAAMALLTGAIAWLAATFVFDRHAAAQRLRKLTPALLVGIMAMAVWMDREPRRSDWPLPGYPQSYLAQLGVKEGNYPERGTASLADYWSRVYNNLDARLDLLLDLTAHLDTRYPLYSPLEFEVLFAVSTGWLACVKNRGGSLADWYFASTEGVSCFGTPTTRMTPCRTACWLPGARSRASIPGGRSGHGSCGSC